MAYIDKLLDQVDDPELRTRLTGAVDALRKGRKFGLVFEEHIPETTMLPSVGVRVGAKVARRNDPKDPDGQEHYLVTEVKGDKMTVVPYRGSGDQGVLSLEDGTEQVLALSDVFVVQYFTEPVYPILKPVGSVRRGTDKRSHAVLNGENFHALQLLLFAYKSKVDCIYIDPPYNTKDTSWRYNNRFVVEADPSRHDKWLSFMEKRLKLAKELLARNGVLIVTIDEHEVHHLGVLIEQLFPGARRQMVTIVNNAAGVTQGAYSRVEEYALFVFLGDSRPTTSPDDLLSDETKEAKTPIWRPLNRYGGINVSAAKRPGLVYPVLVNKKSGRIVGTGRTLTERQKAGEVTGDLNAWRPDPSEAVPKGTEAIWPYKGDGSMSTWENNPSGLMELVGAGFARARPQKKDGGTDSFSLSYVKSGTRAKVASGEIPTLSREENGGPLLLGDAERQVVAKTVWHRSRHDAGKWGTRTVRELLGSVAFDYAKSPYAVLDTLRSIVGSKKNALIVDFFAGSGTTLHATMLLNAEDDGERRCVLVTNNEVSSPTEIRLRKEGKFPGDPEWESEGVFQSVTWPRIHAAVTGKHVDEKIIAGEHLGGRPYSQGFEENVEAFALEYAHRTDIALRRAFKAITPVLWLTAGGIGDASKLKVGPQMMFNSGSTFAVLLNEDHIAAFLAKLDERSETTHVWIVTDSPQAYARMRSLLPKRLKVGMLYRDFLSNFEMSLRLAK
jgi:adenine-specific DNA-methyltransferase